MMHYAEQRIRTVNISNERRKKKDSASTSKETEDLRSAVASLNHVACPRMSL